jgi:TrpR-related protein YerC/YecD
MNKWLNHKSKKLFKAILALETESEVAAFCRDLLTEPEIAEFSGRFAAAELLNQGVSQRETATRAGVSIATVTRVNQWLKRGMNGYKTVLDRLKGKTAL